MAGHPSGNLYEQESHGGWKHSNKYPQKLENMDVKIFFHKTKNVFAYIKVDLMKAGCYYGSLLFKVFILFYLTYKL